MDNDHRKLRSRKSDYRYGQRIEITTFRADSYDQVSRNPEVVFGDRLEDPDVIRDLTLALA